MSKNLNLGKLTGLTIALLLFFVPDSVFCQDYEDWKKKQEEKFQQFKDERDAEFLKMLQDAWEEMQTENSDVEFTQPKPNIIPEVEENFEFDDNSPGQSDAIDLDLKNIGTAPEDFRTRIVKSETSNVPSSALKSTLNYYDVEIEYYYHLNDKIRLKGRPTQKTLMGYWEEMSGSNYEIVLDRVREIQNQLNLNDWGTVQAIYRMGKDLYESSDNDVNLFVWFIMSKLGYDLKVGYNDNNVYVLFPTNRRLFNTKFLTFGQTRYYIIQFEETFRTIASVNTYRGSYPNAEKVLRLDIDKIPVLPMREMNRELSFEWKEKKYKFSIPVNENLVDYFKFFPNTDLDVYINAATSQPSSNALLRELGEIINGKSELEAVNILLKFVQTSFDYETDGDQFGNQKYMLPEEMLYYPYSDCDDRTILFTFLTRKLLNIDVIGLRYPNHIATGVKLDEYTGGDYVTVEGDRYTIADPTYINARVGMTMSKYQNHSPELVRF